MFVDVLVVCVCCFFVKCFLMLIVFLLLNVLRFCSFCVDVFESIFLFLLISCVFVEVCFCVCF